MRPKDRVAWVAVILVLLNSSYLLGGASPSIFYVTNVIAHLLLGAAFAFVWIRLWGDRSVHARNRRLFTVVLSLSLATVVTGLALLALGNFGPQFPVLLLHIGVGLTAGVGTVAILAHRGPIRGRSSGALIGWTCAFAAAVFAVSFASQQERPAIDNDTLSPIDMASELPEGMERRFFPSSSETSDGQPIPEEFFLESESCARSGCHTDAYDQWAASAHRFSSFNNQWYRKSIEYMQEVVGVDKPKWCAGCHDPALLFTGQMAQPVADFIEGEAAQAGLGCVACHSIAKVKSTRGNGGYVIEYPPLHAMATSKNRILRTMHDLVLRLDPEPHRRAFLKPFHTDQPAEFCATCHKVHLDKPVNNYRWVRGFNTYDNWQASGVSGYGARSFYFPEEPQSCVNCHMPETASDDAGNDGGFISGHRFLAANTALPTANEDSVQLAETIRFLKRGQLSVDIFALSPIDVPTTVDGRPRNPAGAGLPSTTFAIGEEQSMDFSGGVTRDTSTVSAPLVDGTYVDGASRDFRLDVVVRSRNVGHFFPSGTVDAQEAWLELKVENDAGEPLFWSGWVSDGDGPVDSSAHFFRTLAVDAHGNPIDKRNAWASRSMVYANLIPPGAGRVAHYRLRLPQSYKGRLRVTARLNYRKFNWFFNQFAYAGKRDTLSAGVFSPDFDDGSFVFASVVSDVSGKLQSIPTIPVVELAADTLDIYMDEPSSNSTAIVGARERWNDYGIGLLLEGDLLGAERAFKRVVEADDTYVDGYLNLARVFLQQGELELAEDVLRRAVLLQPDLTRIRYFRGLLHKARGDLLDALRDLQEVADEYPRDRVVLNEIGRAHFLNGSIKQAIPWFERSLRIDSEDLTAHYNLMLLYRASGNDAKAEAHEMRYRRYKADEASIAVSRSYRRAHPSDNNEAQPIHEHSSSW